MTSQQSARSGAARRAAWSRMARLGIGLGVICLMVVIHSPHWVSAQSAAVTATEKIRSIRERMDLGQSLYAAGNFEGAARIFDDSFAKYPYSAFLFNAGVCFERLGKFDEALGRFEKYLKVDPAAPDLALVRERIEGLIQQKAVTAPGGAPGTLPDGGATSPTGLSGPDGGAPLSTAVPPLPRPGRRAGRMGASTMKSLVIVETEPPGAPLELWAPKGPRAQPFSLDRPSPDWSLITSASAPANLTLDVGRYHVVIRKYRDYNQTERDIEVTPGKVLHFMANLSQGRFLGFLRVAATVPGAQVYLDDPSKQKPPWGVTPHAELVGPGAHQVLVEAPGFQPLLQRIQVEQGEQHELNLTLNRLPWGILRIDATAPEVWVRVDGVSVGVWRSGEPPLEVRLSAGPKELEVSGKKRKTFRGLVNIPKGQVLPVHVRMIHTYPRGPAWTQAIIAGVLVGASTYFGVESNRLHRDLLADRNTGVLASDDPRLLRGKIYAIGADTGFAAGGALALLATYNFLKDPLPESSHESLEPQEFEERASVSEVKGRRLAVHPRAPGLSIGAAPSGSHLQVGWVWLGGQF